MFFFIILFTSITPTHISDWMQISNTLDWFTSVLIYPIDIIRLHMKKKRWTGLLATPEYELSSLLLNLAFNSTTSCSTFYNWRPWTSSWAYLIKRLSTAPASSCGPFPWPDPKKFQRHVHPTCDVGVFKPHTRFRYWVPQSTIGDSWKESPQTWFWKNQILLEVVPIVAWFFPYPR